MYNVDISDDNLRKKLTRFDKNGWHLEDLLVKKNLIHDAETGSSMHGSLNSIRRVGDNYAYRIELNTDGIDRSTFTVPSYVLDHCEFSIEQDTYCKNIHPDLECEAFRHPLLRWLYTMVPVEPQSGREGLFRHIEVRLYALLALEIAKLPPEDRPYGYRRDIDSGDGSVIHFVNVWKLLDWDKPQCWRYLDHVIPKWYDLFAQDEEIRVLEVDNDG